MSVVKLRSYLSVTYFICFIVDLCVYLSQLVVKPVIPMDWSVYWLVGQWVGLSIGWSVNGLVCLLVGWSMGWSVYRLVGQWVDLSIGWSTGNGLSIGQLVNGLVR